MSNADLDLLEREVVAARGRLAGNMARLRDPAALASFKSEVTIQANSIKDEWAQKVSDVATNAARTIWSDFKDRAVANPGAAFAIGAGLAWALYAPSADHHPTGRTRTQQFSADRPVQRTVSHRPQRRGVRRNSQRQGV